MYFITILLLLYGLLLVKKEKKVQLNHRITAVFQNPAEGEGADTEEADVKRQTFSKRIINPILKNLKKNFQKKLSMEKQEKIELKLQQAGNPFGMTAVDFKIVQAVLLIMLPLLAGGYGYLINMAGAQILLLAIFGLAAARYVPAFYLKSKVKSRNKQALLDLPDFLDLLTVSIEAGLGFDSALTKVVAKKEGVLSTEFQRCLEEMRLGKTRKEALSGVRSRLQLEDMSAFIGAIIQAEQMGIGMVQVLRVQSNEIRNKRKQRAEEQAMKAPIKMLFPLVLFIFPCIFIVLLGPAIIQILETL
ncbi:type II secretion system F family protein [Evansella clarkii]|uniref:type II secretion system F family protein n=1 Tax=Evansella clarkii TaxID=79879 RepID=UPI001F442CD3|nr:type II secretion system F family protein [Evansella clarkii]